ncbi:MAG: right-handed parallel beta-helix repeat-containing protein, partial [Chitinophagales bacterium]
PYTVIAINDAGCCLSQDINFTSVSCCNSDAGLTYQNPTPQTLIYNLALKGFNADWNTNTLDMTGLTQKIALNGEFTLDRNITINNCDYFTFNKNVPLNLNGYKLTQFGSDFYSCDGINMWNGISGTLANSQYSASGTSTNLSRVRDAKTGVYISASGSVITSNTSFEDNNVGIEFAGTNNYSTSAITLTVFKTVLGLKAPFASSLKGLHGLVINSSVSGITVGNNTAGLENTFDNLYNGIYSLTRSTLNLYRNIFTSITGTGAYPYYGKAGYIDVSTISPVTVTVTGTGQYAATPAISNCDFGFLIKGFSSTSLSDYKIDNVLNAIQVSGSLGTTILIYNNTITNGKYGIGMLLNQSSNQTISGNVITVASPASFSDGFYGITIQDYPGSNNINEIYSNTLTDGRYGAYLLNNGSNTVFQYNNIYMTSTSNTYGPVYGIYASASNGATLLYNNLYGNAAQYNAAFKKEAITLYQSQNMIVTCNTLNKFGYGIHFKGNCANTFLRTNVLGVAFPVSGDGLYYGLVREYFNGSDLIGNQGDATHSHYNYMYGPFTNSSAWAAYHINTVTAGSFYYNSTDIAVLKTFTQGGTFGSAGFQFVPSTSAVPYNCPQPTIREEEDGIDSTAIDYNAVASAIQQLIAITTDTTANETELWMNQQVLYASLDQDTAITFEDEDLKSFYDSIGAGDMAKLNEFSQTLQLLSDSIEGLSSTSFVNATDLNSQIGDSLLFALNEKQVNDSYLKVLTSGIDTLSHDEKEFISTMAFSCPSVNGVAVFKARALYGLTGGNIYFDDDTLCRSSSNVKLKQDSPNNFLIYPNPSRDFAIIKFRTPVSESTTLVLFDILSRNLISVNVPAGTEYQSINCTALSAGIYNVHIDIENSIKESQNLVIVK